jgi:transposase InsO family protein
MCQRQVTVGIGDIKSMSDIELEKAKKAILECSACAKGKAHRNATGHRGLERGTQVGEVLHMDTFYAVTRDPRTEEKRSQYCLLATDAYSEWRWANIRLSMTELQDAAIDIIRHSETMTGRRPRLIISDLGSEFNNSKVKVYCRERGIQLQPSPARTKELNGLAEKSVDTVKNHVRTMLLAAGMPEQMGWSHAVLHHIYIWNRTHVGQHTGVSPQQAMTGKEPNVMYVGVFGCDTYVHQDKTQRDTTFSRKAEAAIYLGHSGRENCPVVRIPSTGKIISAKDVVFREGSFTHLRAEIAGRANEIEVAEVTEATEADTQTVGDTEIGDVNNDINDKTDTVYTKTAAQQPKFRLRAITDAQTIDGTKKYRVKWIGYPSETWEPATQIEQDAPDAVREYESFIQQRAEARVTRSRTQRESGISTSSMSVATVADSDDETSSVDMAAAYAARCL